MLSKGIPLFLLINVLMYDMSESALTYGTIKNAFTSGNVLSSSAKNSVKVEDLFLENNDIRSKRGIVLIDEDFDKLPDSRVRQSWSGENTASDVTDFFKESEKDSPTDEGSGQDSTMATKNVEEESTLSEQDATLKNGEQNSTMAISITPGKLRITKEKFKLTSLLDSTLEGSGDDITTPTESDEMAIKDDILLSCSNSTCDSHEITVLPGFSESVSEDSTLIITCSTSNFSSGDSLQWYRSNGSDNFHLEASIVKNQLQFAIPKVKVEDSGKYMCIRLSKQNCCHKYLDVTVYKKPNYKFHLLIVGLVALTSLFICLLLGIHRRYQVKQFKKQLKTQIPLNEFLL